jgi:hypothetical protein
MNEPLESLPPPPVRPPLTNRARSPRLAWAITLGESALLAGAAFPLGKYWLMLPVPVRLGGATVLAALASLVIFRLVRFHLRWSRRRSNTRRTIIRPPDIEPEPASALPAPNVDNPVPEELPCEKRSRNPAILTPTGSSTCP